MIKSNELMFFVRESNRIESIHRDPTKAELAATEKFLDLNYVHITDLEEFVSVVQPGARLRDREGMDVRIGQHIPPRGGLAIPITLQAILDEANDGFDPYPTHVKYETLHPFMDGNGRSGRVLWGWQMLRQDMWPRLKLGFLHCWYYQSLEHSR